MANTYYKYAPNVWLAKCDAEHVKGDIILIANKYGKEAEHEVFKLIGSKDGFYYYSAVRIGENYAEKKAEKYAKWAKSAENKSDEAYNAAQEGREFLSLGEPIKVGHHSEGRHRALIERNDNRMRQCVEMHAKAESHESKAKYWELKAKDINLGMPESFDFLSEKLEEAKVYHSGLKDGSIKKEHSYSLTYAKKRVNELEKLVKLATLLWGEK